MITAYLKAALKQAKYERLEDGTYYAEIPGFEGVWSNCATRAEVESDLSEVLEEWVLFRIWQHLDVPVIDGIKLLIKEAG